MAISKPVTLLDNFGEKITFANAYIKIEQVISTKLICSSAYLILKEKDGLMLERRFVEFPLNLDGTNPIKQAYLYLKTLPEFADAVDC